MRISPTWLPIIGTYGKTALQSMNSREALEAWRRQSAFVATGPAAGNLTLGKVRVDGRDGLGAVIEPRLASGALGVVECEKLASAFKVTAATRQPLLLWIDSAGARVSEGLPALGAFRRMYAAALKAAASGVPITAVCGTHCFGGASMLAALAGVRYYCANTRFAMSGPAILAQTAGLSNTDEMFQAMAQAAIGMQGRMAIAPTERRFVGDTFALSAVSTLVDRHTMLHARLNHGNRMPKVTAPEPVRRKDFEKLYAAGYEVHQSHSLLTGSGIRDGKRCQIVGWTGGGGMGAGDAWQFADAVMKRDDALEELHVLIDCEAHAASLEDERLLLSEYVAHLGACLHHVVAQGRPVRVFVLRKLGGGIYVALAAPATEVVLLYGAEIQLLPGRAIASILGTESEAGFAFADYRKAGVADTELKLGLV